MQINILPDKKLYTKYIYTLLTIYIFLILLTSLLQFLIPLDDKISYMQAAQILWPICLGLIILSSIISIPILKLWLKNLSFTIESDRVIIKKGILSKVEQNIPFRAITDFMLHRSLYDRFLGIASIRVQTAGQSANPTGYEGSLTGVLNYDEVYTELRKRLNYFNSSSDSDEENKMTNFSTPDLLTKILMELTTIREMMENKIK